MNQEECPSLIFNFTRLLSFQTFKILKEIPKDYISSLILYQNPQKQSEGNERPLIEVYKKRNKTKDECWEWLWEFEALMSIFKVAQLT